MKIFDGGTRFLFVVGLLLLLVTSNLRLAIGNLYLYEFGFHKYGIPSRTGISNKELIAMARGLISYFNSEDSFSGIKSYRNNGKESLFNQRELIHLRDVKGLIRLTYKIQEISAMYIAAFLIFGVVQRRRAFLRELASYTLISSAVIIAVLVFLAMATLIGFEQLFLQFHLSSFSNYLWLLDPSQDYLIMIFPQGFFRDATLFIAGATLAEAVAIGVGAGFFLTIVPKRMGVSNV